MRTDKNNRQQFRKRKVNNLLIEEYETKESKLNFNQREFMKSIREEMGYMGMDKIQLANCIYSTQSRISGLLSCTVVIKKEEIEALKKLFNID